MIKCKACGIQYPKSRKIYHDFQECRGYSGLDAPGEDTIYAQDLFNQEKKEELTIIERDEEFAKKLQEKYNNERIPISDSVLARNLQDQYNNEDMDSNFVFGDSYIPSVSSSNHRNGNNNNNNRNNNNNNNNNRNINNNNNNNNNNRNINNNNNNNHRNNNNNNNNNRNINNNNNNNNRNINNNNNNNNRNINNNNNNNNRNSNNNNNNNNRNSNNIIMSRIPLNNRNNQNHLPNPNPSNIDFSDNHNIALDSQLSQSSQLLINSINSSSFIPNLNNNNNNNNDDDNEDEISENEISQNPRIIHLQGLGELAMLVAILDLLNGQRDHPVNKKLLDDLPEIPIKNVNKLENDKKRCNICLEDFNNGEYVLILPCLHIYHTKCIKEWFNSNNTCPLCKSLITESKIYGEEGRYANTPGK